jgi:hypothetical protein
METKSIMSRSSHKSEGLHNTVNSARAKALAAKAGVMFMLKEAEIKKQRAALDTDLDTEVGSGRSFF